MILIPYSADIPEIFVQVKIGKETLSVKDGKLQWTWASGKAVSWSKRLANPDQKPVTIRYKATK
jgi:hypothetical protein